MKLHILLGRFSKYNSRNCMRQGCTSPLCLIFVMLTNIKALLMSIYNLTNLQFPQILYLYQKVVYSSLHNAMRQEGKNAS